MAMMPTMTIATATPMKCSNVPIRTAAPPAALTTFVSTTTNFGLRSAGAAFTGSRKVCKRRRASISANLSNLSDSDSETRAKLSGLHVVMTGGTGLIGRALCRELLSSGCRVTLLSRKRRMYDHMNDHDPRILSIPYDASSGYISEKARRSLCACDAVVNLAGEPIDSHRWSSQRKKVLRNSRVLGTRAIAAVLPEDCRLISASAIGYYGGGNDSICTEDTMPARNRRDFLSVLAAEWEKAATLRARATSTSISNTTVCRFGVVLSTDGGAVPKMAAAFRAYMGGAPGDGRSWMSWVHLDDVVRFLCRSITNNNNNNSNTSKVYNVVAPNPVMLREFCNALGHALQRPCWVPIPANAIRAIMGSEAAQLVLAGQRVIPKNAVKDGFKFRYTNVNAALKDVFRDVKSRRASGVSSKT